MFSRIVVSALFAGAVAGLIAGLLQLIFVQPVLLHAELYEGGDLVHFGAAANSAHPELPGFDVMRDGLSLIFSMAIYTGYALIMVGLFSIAEEYGPRITARQGMIWGIAGFVAFHLAPGFSLPPEVPGVAAAGVAERQVWWFATVGVTALALAMIAFGRSWMFWGVAVILIAAPHIIGAPEPDTLAGPVPPEIAALFAARALGVGLAAWVILGALAGFFWQKEPEE